MLIVLRSQSHLPIGVLRGDSPFELIQEIPSEKYIVGDILKLLQIFLNLKDRMGENLT